MSFSRPPCILRKTTASDWVSFLNRSVLAFKSNSERDSLHRLLKFGPELNYWNEFVLKAYHNHQHDAIFLAGVPDLRDTLPHA